MINKFSNIITVLTIIATTISLISFSLQIPYVDAFPKKMLEGNYTFGKINSIQNDDNGNPTWIVSGHWKTNYLLNSTETSSQNNSTIFSTMFKMIKVDGTAEHMHSITDFSTTDIIDQNNMVTTINGTSTINTPDGNVTDIPTSIVISNDKVISIWLEPETINNHLGDTPLYGLVKSGEYHKGKYK